MMTAPALTSSVRALRSRSMAWEAQTLTQLPHPVQASDIDGVSGRDGLGERSVYRAAQAEAGVPFVRSGGLAHVLAAPTGPAFLQAHLERPRLQLQGEVACLALHADHPGVGPDLHPLVMGQLSHQRRERAHGAVLGQLLRGDDLADLDHGAADGGRVLDQVRLHPQFGQVPGRGDAGDAPADDGDIVHRREL